MPREPRTYLWEARRAADLIRTFVEGQNDTGFKADALVRSAVERQFEIIGESLGDLPTDETSQS